MRKLLLLCTAAAVMMIAATFAAHRAEAMTIAAPAAINAAAEQNSLKQDAAYFCRRVWRCGSNVCGWRRTCSQTAPAPYWWGYGYGPYRYAPYRYYRPYRYAWRNNWRWRRHWH